MKKIMLHPNGVEKKIKVGFSWTTFFFSWIPSVCRGDIKSALKLFFVGIVTLGIYPAVKCFSINKDYEEYLVLKGFKEGAILKEGFPEIKLLEYIAIVLEIAIPILVIIFYIIFGVIFSGVKRVEISPNGITIEAVEDSGTTVHGDKVIPNKNNFEIDSDGEHIIITRNDTSADSLEPAPKEETYKVENNTVSNKTNINTVKAH